MTDAERTAQIERIVGYVTTINTTITEEQTDIDLLAFVVSEILDRVRLYLNVVDVPVGVERALAGTVSTIFNKYKKTSGDTDVEREVSSVTDNGQSVSYSTKVKSYLVTSSDEELFTGIESLLKRYRRLNFSVTTD